MRRKVLGSAFDEYVAQVEAQNAPLMANVKWLGRFAANAMKGAAGGAGDAKPGGGK